MWDDWTTSVNSISPVVYSIWCCFSECADLACRVSLSTWESLLLLISHLVLASTNCFLILLLFWNNALRHKLFHRVIQLKVRPLCRGRIFPVLKAAPNPWRLLSYSLVFSIKYLSHLQFCFLLWVSESYKSPLHCSFHDLHWVQQCPQSRTHSFFQIK